MLGLFCNTHEVISSHIRFDDPNDTQAIKIGFRLYDNFKDNIDLLTEEAIMEEVIKAYKNKKPLSIERCEYHSYY